MDESSAFALRSEPRLSAKHAAFPYQQEAVAFVQSREACAIFHEQGLGKTKIAIDAILGWLATKQIDTALIFTKKALVDNWRREFDHHSYLKPSILTESGSHNYYVFTAPVRVIVAHYEVAKKEEKRLTAWLKTRRAAVVLDEAVVSGGDDLRINGAVCSWLGRLRTGRVSTSEGQAGRKKPDRRVGRSG